MCGGLSALLLTKRAAVRPSPTGVGRVSASSPVAAAAGGASGSSADSQGPTSVPPSPGRDDASWCEDVTVSGVCNLVCKGPREDVSSASGSSSSVSSTSCHAKTQNSSGSRGSAGGLEGSGRQRSGKGTDSVAHGVGGRVEGRVREERARSGASKMGLGARASGARASVLTEDKGARLDMDSDAMLGVHTLMMLAGTKC